MSQNLSIEIYYIIVLTLLFPTCALIVKYYAEPGFPWYSYITLTLGYYAAFGILLLVPIDIGVVVKDRTSTVSETDLNYNYNIIELNAAYNTFFTMLLILGSVVLVFEEYYNTDGYFSWGGRLWSAFKRMMFDMVVPGVAGLIVLGILIGQKVVPSDAEALKLAAVVVTNTMYEFVLMFMLGYALIEYPRSLWGMSNLDGYLLKIQMKAAAEFKEIQDNQLNISLAVADVLKTKSQLAQYGDPTLVEAMDILASECPSEFRSDRMGKVATNKSGQVTIDTLAVLRTRLNVLKDLYKMSQEKVEMTKIQAYALEDIVAAKNNPSATVIHWSLSDKDSTESEFNWTIKYQPVLFKVAAVFTGVLSFLSFLGVICSMHGVPNSTSPYFLAVHSSSATIAGIVFFIFLTFGYTVYIITWAILQIKVGAASELVPGRTTPEALSFNVRMVARLAAPLAFFYLGWISENGIRSGSWTANNAPTVYNITTIDFFNTTSGIVEEYNITSVISGPIFMPSGFSHFYQLDSIGVVQQVFGTIFPIVLFVVTGLFAVNAFNRLLVCCKLGKYQFGAPIVTDDVLQEGRRQLQRNKKNMERKVRRGDLKNIIAAAHGGGGSEGGGFLSWIMSGFSNAGGSSTGGDTNARDTSNAPTISEPGALKGTVEKKAAGTFGVGGGWKEMYMEVRSPGYLHFYKDKRAADMAKGTDPSTSSDSAAVIVDLRLVMAFSVPERRNKENLELDVEMSEETIKLKFKTLLEVDSWRRGLGEWKDFFVDYGSVYPNGMAASDPERGSVSRSSNVSASASASASAAGNSSMSRNPLSASNKSRANELDSVVVGDDDDDDADKGVRPLMGGMLSSSTGGLFNFGRKKKDNVGMAAANVHDDKPKQLEGWLEKKGHGKMTMGGDWQKRYLRIDEDAKCLVYSKSSSPSEKPAGSIDLKLVQDILPYEKGGNPDYTRFNVDMGDKVYKFRAPNETEGQKWIDGLNAWRDHFLLNM